MKYMRNLQGKNGDQEHLGFISIPPVYWSMFPGNNEMILKAKDDIKVPS